MELLSLRDFVKSGAVELERFLILCMKESTFLYFWKDNKRLLVLSYSFRKFMGSFYRSRIKCALKLVMVR